MVSLSVSLSLALLIPKTSLELSANCLSVDAAKRRRRAKEINENNETDLQKYAPKKKAAAKSESKTEGDQFLFLLFDIWLFDILFFLVRAAVSLCRNDVMRRQKELPKIKICLFKATTVE